MTSRLSHIGIVASLLIAAAGLPSCGLIYEDLQPCEVKNYVRLNYDYNMKFADATASEVMSATLHVMDPATGKVVKTMTADRESLLANDYRMDLDGLAPGTYNVIAWCGDPQPGTFDMGFDGSASGLTARLRTDNGTFSSEISRLYHSQLGEVTVHAATDETVENEVHESEMRLVKDSNNLRVILQQLETGVPMDPALLELSIVDDNALLAADNSVVPSGTVTYKPFDVQEVHAEIGTRAESTNSSLIAEFGVGRLMASHKASTRLIVRRTDTNQEIINIRLIEALLLSKGYYSRSMDDQEFLDRKDDYTLTFFLERGMTWMRAYIIIEDWMIVIQDPAIL